MESPLCCSELLHPYSEWIERCDKKIASILAVKEGPAALNPPNPPRK